MSSNPKKYWDRICNNTRVLYLLSFPNETVQKDALIRLIHAVDKILSAHSDGKVISGVKYIHIG